jgi:hypothetical protein
MSHHYLPRQFPRLTRIQNEHTVQTGCAGQVGRVRGAAVIVQQCHSMHVDWGRTGDRQEG